MRQEEVNIRGGALFDENIPRQSTQRNKWLQYYNRMRRRDGSTCLVCVACEVLILETFLSLYTIAKQGGKTENTVRVLVYDTWLIVSKSATQQQQRIGYTQVMLDAFVSNSGTPREKVIPELYFSF